MALNTWHMMLALVTAVSSQITTDHDDTCQSAVIEAISQLNERMISQFNERMMNLENKLLLDSRQQKHVCDRGWTRIGGSCYTVPPIKKDWHAANSYCRTELGSNLAIVDDKEELTSLITHYEHMRAHIWVGAKLHSDDNEFYWEDCVMEDDGHLSCEYTKVKDELWGAGQPHRGKEATVSLWYHAGADNLYLADWSTTPSHNFLCEYKLT